MNRNNNFKPIVSIVTPSFNQGQFLEETIRSVLRQDYENVEYIVIDGNSKDDSIEIIKRYEKQIATWVSEPDKGQSDAIRKGFQRASGDVMFWLNSDDVLLPSAVSLAVDAFRRNSEIEIVYGDRLFIDSKGNVLSSVRYPSYWKTMFQMNISLPQECTFFLRTAYEKAGGVDVALEGAMDFDLWCRMQKRSNFLHIPVFLGCYREHRMAKSCLFGRTEWGLFFAKEHEDVYRRHFGKPFPSKIWRNIFYGLFCAKVVREIVSPQSRRLRQRIRKQLVSGEQLEC